MQNETVTISGYHRPHIVPDAHMPSSSRINLACSFIQDAIARHGAGKGLLLAACRIARCNPLCEGGDDPAPEHFSLLKLKS